MEAVRGGKKKYTPTADSQLKLNPFNYSPEVEAWGAKKKLSSIPLQERETPLPLLKFTLKHSLHGVVWMSRFKSYRTPKISNMYIMDRKRALQCLTCVLRADGLCYLRPIHAVLLIHNNPPSGATPTVRKRQTNGVSEKKSETRRSASRWGVRVCVCIINQVNIVKAVTGLKWCHSTYWARQRGGVGRSTILTGSYRVFS